MKGIRLDTGKDDAYKYDFNLSDFHICTLEEVYDEEINKVRMEL